MDEGHVCLNHPDREALSFCHHCGAYYCPECLKAGPEFYYCGRPECLQALEAELHPPAPPPRTPAPALALPENSVALALYPNLSEAEKVKARLGSAGLESFPAEMPCGLIEEPYTVPVQLRVKPEDSDKAAQLLKGLPSEGLPEPVDQVMNYIDPGDADEAQAKLAALGIESFLWDSLSGDIHQIHEAVCLLVRSSQVEKAANLLVVPETE
jgi:hypothetical protein